MDTLPEFESHLTAAQKNVFRGLDSPLAIQAYLDRLPYVAEERDRTPLAVLQDGQCHCLDGGIFAALALSRLGQRPRILDLVPDPGKDDDHVLALFEYKGACGAVAKSNYVGLRFREPVYRSLRELVMTYFEWYTSVENRKTLRGYTRPLDLSRLERFDWMRDEAGIREISRRLYRLKPVSLISPENAAQLSPLDERAYAANTQGTNFDWVYGVRSNQ